MPVSTQTYLDDTVTDEVQLTSPSKDSYGLMRSKPDNVSPGCKSHEIHVFDLQWLKIHIPYYRVGDDSSLFLHAADTLAYTLT